MTQILDKTFYVPEWTDDLDYGERDDYDVVYSDDLGDQPASFLDVSDFDEAADDIDMDSHDSTETPNTISIASQKIRFANNGSMVVDVVFLIEEVSSATVQYDFRVTKTG